MQQIAERLAAYMRHKGVNQAQLAQEANVSQSTVSRILNGRRVRSSEALVRLSRILHENAYPAPDGDNAGRERILSAVDNVWDGSAEHAEVIARVVEALADCSNHRRSAQGRDG